MRHLEAFQVTRNALFQLLFRSTLAAKQVVYALFYTMKPVPVRDPRGSGSVFLSRLALTKA